MKINDTFAVQIRKINSKNSRDETRIIKMRRLQ